MKPDPKKWPNLKRDWDAYGHDVSFDELDGIKASSTHGYVVVRWKDSDGSINIADLASPDSGKSWIMQNDYFDPITEADWRNLRCVPDCDWFEIISKGEPLG